MVLNDLFKDVPNNRFLLLNHFLGLLDGRAVSRLFKTVVDERLEELECHLLGKTALVQLQFGADDDHGTSGVVDALSKQVLTEASLLTLEGVREGLQRTVVGATQHAATTSVIE